MRPWPKVVDHLRYWRMWLDRFRRYLTTKHPTFPLGTYDFLEQFEQWFRRIGRVPKLSDVPPLFGLSWHLGSFPCADLTDGELERKLLERPSVVDDRRPGSYVPSLGDAQLARPDLNHCLLGLMARSRLPASAP